MSHVPVTYTPYFTEPLSLMWPAQYLICAKVLAVGPEKSYGECIGQGDFENDCTWPGPSEAQVIASLPILVPSVSWTMPFGKINVKTGSVSMLLYRVRGIYRLKYLYQSGGTATHS